MKTISTLFLDAVKECVDEETLTRIVESVERYDRPYIDAVQSPTVLSVSNYGSISLTGPGRFLIDPWSAKNFYKGDGCQYFLIDSSGITHVDAETAGKALYDVAKAEGFPETPRFNDVMGYVVSFEELRGSVPEFMREALEAKTRNERTDEWEHKAHNELLGWYRCEVDQLLKYMRTHTKRVEVKDKDNPEHSEWVDVPVSKLSVCFNRFDSCNMATPDAKPTRAQVTAFFSVSDQSPEFKPDVNFNWHLQDTSRWLYAGAIAIDYSCDAEGKETISISSNH